jgi:hypothetical protein
LKKRRIDILAFRYRVTIVSRGQPLPPCEPGLSDARSPRVAEGDLPLPQLASEIAHLLAGQPAAEPEAPCRASFNAKRLWRALFRLMATFKRRIKE